MHLKKELVLRFEIFFRLHKGMADLVKIQLLYSNVVDCYERTHKKFWINFINIEEQWELAGLVSFTNTTFSSFL